VHLEKSTEFSVKGHIAVVFGLVGYMISATLLSSAIDCMEVAIDNIKTCEHDYFTIKF
jgi:hypothetical protein